MHGPSVKDTRERAASPIELQDLAKSLRLSLDKSRQSQQHLSARGRFGLRIPMKPAIDSDLKPAGHSDFIPAGVPN